MKANDDPMLVLERAEQIRERFNAAAPERRRQDLDGDQAGPGAAPESSAPMGKFSRRSRNSKLPRAEIRRIPLLAAYRTPAEAWHAGCSWDSRDFPERTDMTALTAGYATAIPAILFAAAVAVTIVVNVNGLDSTDEEPSRKETARKVAA